MGGRVRLFRARLLPSFEIVIDWTGRGLRDMVACGSNDSVSLIFIRLILRGRLMSWRRGYRISSHLELCKYLEQLKNADFNGIESIPG